MEDQLDLVGATQIEVFALYLLEEQRPVRGRPSTWVRANSACRIDMS